jgi:large subunit ribosomal protein L13
MTTVTEHTIDAAGQKLGRVASQAAKALMGKISASYTPHIDSRVTVTITNASKLHIEERKRLSKTYGNYSGYPSGLRVETLGSLITRKGAGAALRRAIERMLPRNATRTARMKRLKISE